MSVPALLDNTVASGAIAAGTPVPLFLDASFPWASLFYPNGDDLTAADHLGNPLTVWPEVVDRSNKYGKVWVAAPAVAQGATEKITIGYGNPAGTASSNYSTLFSKRIADGSTVALFPCDSVAAAATASTVGGYSLALTATPTLAGTDGGNFRARVPPQAFASGGFLTFNGTTQYGTASGLLDSPPAAGAIGFRFRIESSPTAGPGATLISKASAFSGGNVTEGLLLTLAQGTQGCLSARIISGGTTYEALADISNPWATGVWYHVVIGWGSKLQLWVDGNKYAETAHTGAWANGSSAPLAVAAQFLAAASNFANISVDELEVRNSEPSRTDVLTWFNRGAIPQHSDFDRWTRDAGNPLLAATLTPEQGVVFEPRLVRLAAGSWVGTYTGGNSAAQLFGMTSTDGVTLAKTGNAVMGHGVGGHAGDACRSFLFQDLDGSLHLYFSDAIATTGGSIWHATTTDNGTTWTKQAVLVAPDSTHLGWANTSVVRVGSTYYWLIEWRDGGGAYHVSHFTSTSIAGPLTLIDDTLNGLTLQQGTGGYSPGGLVYVNGKFHFFPHISRASVLPTAIYHAVSTDCRRWDVRNGGNPIIDLGDFSILSRQDQCADASVFANPDNGTVRMLFDIDDNHGGGLQTRIVGASFAGTLAALDVEYPNLRLTTAPSSASGAALLI